MFGHADEGRRGTSPTAFSAYPLRPSETRVSRSRAVGEVTSVRLPTGRHSTSYWIVSYTLNIGMYIATTMKPTMPPTSTIMTGSRMEVRALMAAATSSS